MSYITIPILRGFDKISKLFEIVSKDNLGFLAGGFARFCASSNSDPSRARDIDIFTRGQTEYDKLFHILRWEQFLLVKSLNDLSTIFKTSDNENWKNCPQINLIKPIKKDKLLTFGSTLEEILDNFDFSICRAGIISSSECLVHEDFIYDEKKKNIHILKMESPVAVILRIAKYAAMGYRVNVPEVLSIFKEWDSRGEEYKLRLYHALDVWNGKTNHDSAKNSELLYDLEKNQDSDLYSLIRI